MAKPIQQALALVKSSQSEVNKLLSGPEHIHNLLEINSNFERIVARLNFMGGILEPNAINGSKKQAAPIKTFMGQKLDTVKPLKADDLTPAEARKKEYLAKVEKLWAEIGNYSPQDILTNYRIENDILILRGVAKRAGMEDFKREDLTIALIEELQTTVQIKKEEADTQQRIDSNSTPGKEAVKPDNSKAK